MGIIKVEIQLNKNHATRLASGFEGFRNDLYFLEEAFEPRNFTIAIQRGDFVTDWDRTSQEAIRQLDAVHSLSLRDVMKDHEDTKDRFCRYSMRLCFDQSPFPPLAATKMEGPFCADPKYNLDLSVFKNFVGGNFNKGNQSGRYVNRRLVSPQRRPGRAMNDPLPAGDGNCVVT